MDGTTATTLAPSEEEMNQSVDIFSRMRDAVIGASKLASEVDELRNAVGSLRNELESLRSTNRWMDGQITELRQQRDAALSDLSGTQTELNKVRIEREDLRIHSDNQRETLARLNEQVAGLRKERDDAQFLVEEVKGERDEALDKLHEIERLVCPKEPVGPTPMPPPNVEQPRDPETQQFKSWQDDPTNPDGSRNF